MNRLTVWDCMKALLTRVRQVSPRQALFGDEPLLVLLALVVGGFVFLSPVRGRVALAAGDGAAGGLAHVWLWCQEVRLQEGGNADRKPP